MHVYRQYSYYHALAASRRWLSKERCCWCISLSRGRSIIAPPRPRLLHAPRPGRPPARPSPSQRATLCLSLLLFTRTHILARPLGRCLYAVVWPHCYYYPPRPQRAIIVARRSDHRPPAPRPLSQREPPPSSLRSRRSARRGRRRGRR